MRITLVSRSWPPCERSGVSFSAYSHARILLAQGHEVSIIGSMGDVESVPLPIAHKTYIYAAGSGALYSPVRMNRWQLAKTLRENAPDLVIVEAWQTAITDCAIEQAFGLRIPVLMISHGISLCPYQYSIAQFIRSFAWLPYRILRLPRLMKKLSAITTLDGQASSTRFFDRDLAKKMGVPIQVLQNFPMHHVDLKINRVDRKVQILVVGYFSTVKNQLAAIHVLSHLAENISCCFIGDRQGEYFETCRALASRLNLENRIQFLQDNECDVAQFIAQSALVFSPSVTEVLPMVLIEAMSMGTPFVATSVGAVSSLVGGVLANTIEEQIKAIRLLIDDPKIWERYSEAGKKQYRSQFTEQKIAAQLNEAISIAVEAKIER